MTDFSIEPPKPTFKQAVQKLIDDIKSNRCTKLAYREASSNLTLTEKNQLTQCMYLRDDRETLRKLGLLLSSITETLVVAEFDDGSQHRLIYPECVCINVLREYKRKGIKAWIELV